MCAGVGRDSADVLGRASTRVARLSCDPKRRYPPPTWVGVLVTCVFFADISVAGTLQPFFVDEVLHAEAEWVGIAITVQYASATLGLLLSGLLADAIGLRRTVLLVCLANIPLLNVIGRVRSVAGLVVVRSLLGLCSTYALGLTWVASLAPRARLARWMAATVCFAQAALMCGGFLGGALKGRGLATAGAVVSAVPALVVLALLGSEEAAPRASTHASAGAHRPLQRQSSSSNAASSGAALRRALRTRYFWGLALAPYVQGAYMGMNQALAPLVLKEMHGWDEAAVGRLFQAGGLCALLGHASLTPWLSSKPWRHRAAQALFLLIAATLVAYGRVGEQNAALALALPVLAFVCTAISLGIVNMMVALLARAVAPEALGVLTGLTRCLFTLGYCSLPAALVPILEAGGLIAPCALVAALAVSVVASLQLSGRLPAAAAAATAVAITTAGPCTRAVNST